MEEKRLQHYLAQLSKAANFEVTKAVCPLCLKERSPVEICEGHIVPRALGGRRTTLTCKSCDNTLGQRLEGPMVNFLLNPARIEGKLPGPPHGIRTWIKLGGRDIRVQVKGNDKGGIKLSVYRPQDQSSLDAFVANLTGWPEIWHNLPKDLTDAFVPQLIIRIAYLAAFEECGYVYILRPVVKSIREYVQSPPGELGPPESVLSAPNSEIYRAFQSELDYVITTVTFMSVEVPLVASQLGFALLPPLDPSVSLQYPYWRPGLRFQLRSEGSGDNAFLRFELE